MMKKLLTKSFLVAVLLLLGGVNFAWGEVIETVGKTDKTSLAGTHSSTSIVLKKGETKVITFNNYGSSEESFYNWTIVAKEGGTERFSVRADSWDNTTRAATNVTSYKVATSRGGTKDWLNWDTFKTDMVNASCVALITYGDDNKLSIRTTSECSTKNIYYVDHDATGLGGSDVNIVFYVEKSYLEIMSIRSPQEVIGAIDNTTGYASSVRGDINKALTISQGQKIKLNFNNHGMGVNNWDNWSLRITNTGTSFDRGLAGGNHINQEDGEDFEGHDAYNGITQQWLIDGVDNYTDFMAAYKTGMKDSNVDMTIVYNTDGTFSVTTESTMGGHEYRYVFTRNVAFTGAVTMKLGVDCAWLEILSEEKTVEATIGSTGWTTFASPYALNLSSMTASTGEVAAYYASAVGGSSVTMTAAPSTVAAGEGLMLKGTAGATITIPIVGSGDPLSGNKLVGCTTSTPLSTNANYYVLVNNGGTAEFQSLATNGATIPAGKAYLDASALGVKALSIVFDDTTTGVDEIPGSKFQVSDNAFYNLAGQRVSQPTRGLYIVNGKKVMIK